MMGLSVLQETRLRFRNSAIVKVRVITISSAPVAAVLESCRLIFSMLDRGDGFQASLCRRLWEFRAYILFTALPFDSSEIGLLFRLQEIMAAAATIPCALGALNDFESAALYLLNHPENPKFRWISSNIGAEQKSASEDIGFFSMMAMGRNFGCPEALGKMAIESKAIDVIDSRSCLISAVFDRIIIPGSCHYLSSTIFTELFYEGRSRAIDVLVYRGEWFSLRPRMPPPESTIFRGRLTSSRMICSTEAISEVTNGDGQDTDACMKDALWKITHDGAAEEAPGLLPARYVLCRDGHGLFVPAHAYFLVWRRDMQGDDVQVENVPVDRLAEGDWLVMQPTDTGYLLDLESEEAGFGQKLEEACDWRPALERLLLTARPEDVAEEMLAEGSNSVSLNQNLRNWAEGSVYGPGEQREFRILLMVLIKHGKLTHAGNLDEYVARHWRGLQELRGIRHKAGVQVQKEIHRQLTKALMQFRSTEEDRPILLDNGIRIRLCQVAALDEQTSWVPGSQLMHFQPMKGVRWHE